MNTKPMDSMAAFIAGLVLIAGFTIGCNSEDGNPPDIQKEPVSETHKEHIEYEEESIVRLDEDEMEEFGIDTRVAGPGTLDVEIDLPGEIIQNPDRLAHIVPRVSGVVRKVYKNLGDYVKTGDVMALLESRELADLKSNFLARKERLALSESVFRREEDLWNKKISAEQEYLQAKRDLAEARIELRTAEQKLHALGLNENYLSRLPAEPDATFTHYEIVAPFSGTVVNKHITLGEALENNSEAFVIADLSSVWVNLSIYQKDLHSVRVGQKVVVSVKDHIPETSGAISYISPLVEETTRTAFARVVLSNAEGIWRPGLFVTGRIKIDNIEVPLIVPRTALQRIGERIHVFVRTEGGFEPREITPGRSDETGVEVLSGLVVGEVYVSKGAFTLKSEMEKEAFGGDHHH